MIGIKSIINSGVYEVNLFGTSKAEFKGKHPCIIVRNLKESDMFYIIPLTTYTKERWEKLRKMLCCRIPSTNSIARIDKMQVRHKMEIPKRWFSEHKLVIPTYEEMEKVYKKMLEYFSLSLDKSLKEYNKFCSAYHKFEELCDILFNTDNIVEEFSLQYDKEKEKLIVACSLSMVNKLSFDEVKNIIYTFVDRKDVCVTYDLIKQQLQMTINKSCDNYLTIGKKYDIF